MADWVLLNESLSIEEMKDYAACHGLPSHVRPLLHFDNALLGWELKGQSLSYNLTKEDVCGQRYGSSLVMFPRRMKQEQAAKWCHTLKGHLPVPQNQEENKELSQLASQYYDECSNTWSTVAWLGIRGNLSEKVWEKTIDSSPLYWDNFGTNKRGPSTSCLCTSVELWENGALWACSPCDEETCVVCQYINASLLYLRGDCKKSEFDRDYILKGVPGRKPMYAGYFRSRMLFSEKTWRLETTIEGGTSSAELQDEAANPLGRHQWKISSIICGVYEVRKSC